MLATWIVAAFLLRLDGAFPRVFGEGEPLLFGAFVLAGVGLQFQNLALRRPRLTERRDFHKGLTAARGFAILLFVSYGMVRVGTMIPNVSGDEVAWFNVLAALAAVVGGLRLSWGSLEVILEADERDVVSQQEREG